MMRGVLRFFAISSLILLMSCESEPSLQKYYVKHQEDDSFMHLDVTTNMLFGNLKGVSSEEKENLKAFRKVNVLAFPIDGENEKKYLKERDKVLAILNNGSYKSLAGLRYSKMSFQLYYLGEPEDIKEIVIMAYSDEKGFSVARILGDNLNAKVLYETLSAAKSGEIKMNLDAFEGMLEME
ncbi:MAG TPA: DUF4252 domain-containing protein [Flavobacteriaceae bacterium]|nr:DUF4252 domain-containing protein [Flavobacteriaceae bacterium]